MLTEVQIERGRGEGSEFQPPTSNEFFVGGNSMGKRKRKGERRREAGREPEGRGGAVPHSPVSS